VAANIISCAIVVTVLRLFVEVILLPDQFIKLSKLKHQSHIQVKHPHFVDKPGISSCQIVVFHTPKIVKLTNNPNINSKIFFISNNKK
jgi:hypothetical protein